MIKKPEYHEQEEYQNRLRKLNELKNLEIEPYPHKFEPTNSAAELHRKYQDPLGHSEDAAAGTTPSVRLAGRLVLFRAMGKNAFAHLQDDSGRIQVMFNRELTQMDGYTHSAEKEGESPIKLIEKKI